MEYVSSVLLCKKHAITLIKRKEDHSMRGTFFNQCKTLNKELKRRFSSVDEGNQYFIQHYFVFLEDHQSDVTSLVITNDNKFIVSSSQDNTLRIRNLQEKIQEAILESHTNFTTSLALTNDNKLIISASADNTLRVWNFQKKSKKLF